MSTDQKPAVNPSATKQDLPLEQTTTIVTATTTVTEVVDPVAPVAAQEAEDSHKVFVGNLSFETKEEGLAEFFGTSGKVLEAKIITIRSHHKRRSAGYGFVTFAALEDALKAAKELDKKELDGREINVEVARPKPVVTKPANTNSESEGESAPKKTKRRARKNKNKKSIQDSSESVQGNDTTKETTKAAKNGKKDKDTSGGEETQTSQSDNASVISDASSSRAPRQPRRKNKSKAKNPEVAAAIAERRRIKKELTEPSQTTLFVANIPYSSTDETLQEVFKNYKVASAHVARMRNGRSKGYGFVDMESHDEQVKALENVKDVELEGRIIYLKVALSERPQETAVNGDEKSAEPVKKEEPVTKKDDAPVKNEEPAKKDAAPANKEEPETKRDVAPVKKEEPATKKDVAPVKKEEPATKKDAAPVKKEEPATKKDAAPVKKAEPVVKKE